MIRRQARERTVALLVVAVVAVVAVALAAVVLTDNRTVRALLSRLVRLLLVSPLAARMPRRRMQRRPCAPFAAPGSPAVCPADNH
jgi:hypothetical protein